MTPGAVARCDKAALDAAVAISAALSTVKGVPEAVDVRSELRAAARALGNARRTLDRLTS